MKKYVMMCAAAALCAAGCDKSGEPRSTAGDDAMRIEAVHPAATRAAADAFESGDVIGLYATEYTDGAAAPLQISGNWANNVAVAYDGAAWTPAKKVCWSENPMDVYGYYPYMTPASIDEHRWAVQLDQSAPETAGKLSGYEASDFLWAKTSAAAQADGAVRLQFAHRCSKLVVRLVKGPDYQGVLPTESELYIHNTVTEATLDFTTGAVTRYLYGEPETIRAKRIDDGTFEAIIVPQRLDSRRPFIEYIANGVSYLLEDTFNFKAGMQHTISLTINSNPDQIAIEIGGTVDNDWQ